MKEKVRKISIYSLLKTTLVILSVMLMLVNFAACVGCPYSFTGASIPPHIKSIAIPFAEDRSGSGEPTLREILTEKLTTKFIEDNNLLVTERSEADALLECVIVSLNDAPAIITTGENVQTRRITISVSVVYRDMVERKVIYEKQFSGYGDYSATGLSDERNNGIIEALENISNDILLDTISGW